ncbi:uncharacterized protein TNCV_5034961 [Trichonephila clavipes]|nr:uncharacterized protein TNCV_5034961 [Trichonephila clavipes]
MMDWEQTLVACQPEEAEDNSKNVLWDHLLQKPPKEVDNPYETLADGKTLRFQYQYSSVDILGKQMSVLPFVCSADYCIKDFLNLLPIMGVNSVEEAPTTDAYLLYNLNGGIFYVKRSDYSNIFHYWCRQERLASITMDLANCEQHSLTLDLDFSPNDSGGPPCTSILPLIESTLKLQLLSHVKHFTYTMAARHGGRDFHIHLPEFVIGHDDYILFCHQHSVPLQYVVQGNGLYKLDILQNMMLAGSGKPDTSAY